MNATVDTNAERAALIDRLQGALDALESGDEAAWKREVDHLAALRTRPMMQGRTAAIVALSYLGAVRAIPNYNVMGMAKASLEAGIRFTAACLGKEGIRCNGISAGPIKTLAASGIADLSKLLGHVASHNPLGRNVTTEEVGNTAAFLLSDLASGITGEITYVDGGYSINALNDEEN